MANTTFTTRMKLAANKREKWYVLLNLEGKRTDRFGGYTEKEANMKGYALIAEYNQDPEAFFNRSKLKGVGIEAMVEEFLSRPVEDDTNDNNRAHMEAILEAHKLADPEDIDKYMLQKLKKTMKDAGAAEGYIAIRLKVLRAFIRFCLDKHYLKVDPWPSKTDQKAKGGQPLMPRYRSMGYYYPDEELRVLLKLPVQATPAAVDLNRGMRLSLIQGWRAEQVWGFRWENMNLDKKTYHLEGMKGAQDRDVPLLPDTLELIKELGVPQAKGRIFERWGNPDAFGLAFRRWRDECGLKRGRLHDLKHTCISKMFEANYTDAEIEEITNTSRAALIHYKHVGRKRLAEKLQEYHSLPQEEKRKWNVA